MSADTLFDDADLHGDLAARAPTLSAPWWKSAAGERSSYRTERGTVPAERQGDVDAVHAAAVHRLVHASIGARAAGDDAAARRLSQAAARLCQEVVGLWASVPLVEER